MKNRKIISIIISMCMLLSLYPIISMAQGWDGTTKTEPKNENGAYVITSAQELAWFADNAGSNNAVLTEDIDLADKEWTPIGKSDSTPYTGVFDGNGHTISNLKISADSQYLGLFGYIGSGGTVKNLSVKGDVTYIGTSTSSHTGGLSAYSKGIIENCLSEVNVTGTGRIGGITGETGSTDAKISNSSNRGIITNTSASGSYYTGGIVGYINVSTTVENVYNMGNITAGKYAGGIVGYAGNYPSVINAYSAGIINCSDTSSRGGIAVALSFAATQTAKKIKNCYFLQNDTINKDLSAFTKTTRDDLCGKTETELKSAAFLTLLGEGFAEDSANINGGYPILAWQKTGAPEPTATPTIKPTATPTIKPTATPTIKPAVTPTIEPTATPTIEPTATPTIEPTATPTIEPTATPTIEPTATPTIERIVMIDGKILTSDNAVISSGHHSIEADYSKIGNASENGFMALAVYNSQGKLQKVLIADETYKLSGEYDLTDGAVIKVFLWKNNFKPATDAVKVDVMNE